MELAERERIAVLFQQEPFSYKLAAEIEPLLRRHWDEIAHYKDIPLDVDWSAYAAAALQGMLRIYTMRDVDASQLVGYAVYVVKPHLHYRGSMQAMQDVLYLVPEHRNAGGGGALIAFADQLLAQDGVKVVYHHVKLAHNFGPLLARLGYEPIETVWGRRLE